MINTCYAISSKNICFNEFIKLIMKFQINCIVDVRKKAYIGKSEDEFEGESLKKNLNKIGIYYIDMRTEFEIGEGELSFYEKINSSGYENGINRIVAGINKGYKIAILCQDNITELPSEYLYVAYGLKKKKINLKHISNEDNIETQEEIEEQLFKKYKIKLIKKVAELSIENIMKDNDLEMDELDFKGEMLAEIYRWNFELLCK